MNKKDSIKAIAKSIEEYNCIAFIGAGVSASFRSKDKTHYKGLPLAKDLLELLKKSKSYLKDCNDLGQALFLLKSNENRQAVEKFLTEELSNSDITPLPCHNCLSRIDFAAYVSMNFDELLERGIGESKNILPIIVDSDVSKVTHKSVPIIKPHGTLSMPQTLRAATDEVLIFSPVLQLYLSSILLNKTVIFLGFGLNDPDFISLIYHLKESIGNYFPKSYAIVKDTSEFQIEFWRKHSIEIIKEDATLFLEDLIIEIEKVRMTIDRNKESWVKNSYFHKFLDSYSVPTETQIIEELIEKISLDVSSDVTLETIEDKIYNAIGDVLRTKTNFRALENLKEDLCDWFIQVKNKKETATAGINRLKESQKIIKQKIQSKHILISSYQNILLYSQSQRVADLLLAIPAKDQQEITIHIVECREKSSGEYHEAKAILNLFRDSNFNIILCSDFTGLNLVGENKIDLILLGAHSVQDDGFTNTCGSKVFIEYARKFKTKIGVVYEMDKVNTVLSQKKSNSQSEIDLGEIIFNYSIGNISKSQKILFESSKYDFVKWEDDYIQITDE